MIIARDKEINRLSDISSSNKSEFVAVYGRRRVGKTFLIREAFKHSFIFQHTGIAMQPQTAQLFAFCSSLKESGLQFDSEPRNWIEAFELLKVLIRKSRRKRKIIFIDELSWMYTTGCDLLSAIESFWNGWASNRNDIVLIVCASATSWMMKNIIHARGGLHHRLTAEIFLQPFCLKECEMFAQAFQLPISREQVVEAYMILGGVPYYWSLMSRSLSLSQNIDKIFFSKDAPLKDEYKYLFASLFDNPTPYMRIVEILATHKAGMTREDIQLSYGAELGGTLTQILEDLESCGFIRSFLPFAKRKKGTLFQLIDCFTLFHFKYLAKKSSDVEFWSHTYSIAAAWRGLAFERVCFWHIPQIKHALGISGIQTEVCSWQCKTNSEKGINGAQIDMLIDRSDKVINICEMKFCDTEYTISKKDEENLKSKIASFRKATSTRKGILMTLVTPIGITPNSHSGIINSTITIDHLFSFT